MKKIFHPFLILPTITLGLMPIVSCGNNPVIKDITITNSSDKVYISFDSVPETYKTNTDLTITYSLTEDYKAIDTLTSSILVNDKEIKDCDGVNISNSQLYIPGKYITDNLIISLQVTDITYPVINASSSHIKFDNLPQEIVKGYGINTPYTIDNDQLVDVINSDIKLDGVSIKNKSGVIFDNNYLQIPGDYTQGILVVSLVLRDKKSCTIDTSSSSGVTITGITSPVVENTVIDATYTIDDEKEVIDKDLSDILVDGVSIAKKTGVKYLDKQIHIPKEYVTGNVTIKIVTEKAKLIDQDWSVIITACNQYESDKDETAFLANFTIDGAAVTSLDELIGAKKLITFSFFNTTTEVETKKTQLVRIVDYNHDTISGTDTKAALSFQLVNLLSDLNGNQLRCEFDNSENNKYQDSTLCDNLTNTQYGYATWYDKDNNKIEDYKDSVYYMLQKGDEDGQLVNGIKPVDKYVLNDTGTYPEYNWVETKMENVSIYPLVFKEMNLVNDSQELVVEETNVSPYKYWVNHDTDSDRIMRDENNNSYYYWLTTPYSTGHSLAWNITDKGQKNPAVVKSNRFGVCFGFAI